MGEDSANETGNHTLKRPVSILSLALSWRTLSLGTSTHVFAPTVPPSPFCFPTVSPPPPASARGAWADRVDRLGIQRCGMRRVKGEGRCEMREMGCNEMTETDADRGSLFFLPCCPSFPFLFFCSSHSSCLSCLSCLRALVLRHPRPSVLTSHLFPPSFFLPPRFYSIHTHSRSPGHEQHSPTAQQHHQRHTHYQQRTKHE